MLVDNEDTVIWPKRFKPLPPGYRVVWTGSHYMWANAEKEGLMSWDAYWCRRCAFEHFNSEHAVHDSAGGKNESL